MSKLKDKLSANMRMVRSGQQAVEMPKATSGKPAIKSTAPKAAPAAGKPAPAADKLSSGEAPQSATALFPTRVWPD